MGMTIAAAMTITIIEETIFFVFLLIKASSYLAKHFRIKQH